MDALVLAKIEAAESQGAEPMAACCLKHCQLAREMPQPASSGADSVRMAAAPAQLAQEYCLLAGEALKSRRALLRVVDRQAAMLEAIEDLRSALDRKDLAAMQVGICLVWLHPL